ncbi:nucleotide-binding universal stress UspA family protein [Bradyrhizobium elkanii]|nr:universal stress protein [Bradyrhizobium elkanii]
MSYASLLVYVNADHVSTNLVAVAAAVADKFSARLIGLSALAVLPPFVAEGVVVVDNATELDIAKMKAKLESAGNKFRSAAGSGREVEWRSAIEFPTKAVIDGARCADLIVIQKGKSDDIYRTLEPGAAILGTGRPLLVVPAAARSLTAEHVFVAWKDTREARRAVQDALPFLREAGRTTVIEVCENDRMDAARHAVNDVASYLARHGIKAEARVEIRAHGSGADQIIGLAEDEGGDLLVAGAYGHNRLNEWVFGGMTRDLLTSSPICCLMSH